MKLGSLAKVMVKWFPCFLCSLRFQAYGQGKSVTAMAGEYMLVTVNGDIHVFVAYIAYEGQSGSKDRGDPQVTQSEMKTSSETHLVRRPTCSLPIFHHTSLNSPWVNSLPVVDPLDQ